MLSMTSTCMLCLDEPHIILLHPHDQAQLGSMAELPSAGLGLYHEQQYEARLWGEHVHSDSGVTSLIIQQQPAVLHAVSSSVCGPVEALMRNPC